MNQNSDTVVVCLLQSVLVCVFLLPRMFMAPPPNPPSASLVLLPSHPSSMHRSHIPCRHALLAAGWPMASGRRLSPEDELVGHVVQGDGDGFLEVGGEVVDAQDRPKVCPDARGAHDEASLRAAGEEAEEKLGLR